MAAKHASLLLLMLALVFVSGCASRTQGVMIPIGEPVEGASLVDILVATTREKSENPAMLFSGERGKEVSLTEVTISIPPDADRVIGHVQWPEKLPPNALRDFATVAVDSRSYKESDQWLKRNLPDTRRVLIFVHGFNNQYEEAVFRFAQIVHDSGAKTAPIAFTWPSRGSIFSYNYDKESAAYSRDALEELLQEVAKNPKVGEITIMAHSMGTWLAVESLRQMAIRNGHINKKITDVVLASPDLDIDVFGKQFEAMGDTRPRFTVFVSQDDRALSWSRRLAGGVDRLGSINPTSEIYRAKLEDAGITVIDLTKIDTGDDYHHGKFAQSPEIVKLLGARIIAGQELTDNEITIMERLGAVATGVGQVVGNAAGIAVSAPAAIFERGQDRKR